MGSWNYSASLGRLWWRCFGAGPVYGLFGLTRGAALVLSLVGVSHLFTGAVPLLLEQYPFIGAVPLEQRCVKKEKINSPRVYVFDMCHP